MRFGRAPETHAFRPYLAVIISPMDVEQAQVHFSSVHPIDVFTRPMDGQVEWQEFDQGPGYFHIPANQEVMVRIRRIDDYGLRELVRELVECPNITTLNLSENRNVTDAGLVHLAGLPHLTRLNLSSCSINDGGLVHLVSLPNLAWLNLAYCNRLSDACLKHIRAMPRLRFVDLQGCLSITRAGISRLNKRNLEIHR